jgi:hypothetical protein
VTLSVEGLDHAMWSRTLSSGWSSAFGYLNYGTGAALLS